MPSVSKQTRRRGNTPRSFIIVGHSCIPSDAEDYILPKHVTCVTTGICGFSTYGTSSLNAEIIQGFFNNDPFFNQSTPEKVIMLDPVANPSPKFDFNPRGTDESDEVEKDPTYIVVNHPNETMPNSKYDFIFSFELDGIWNATKSGVYPFMSKLRQYEDAMSEPIAQIPIQDDIDKTPISVSKIKQIFKYSIYPTAKMVIKQINKARPKSATLIRAKSNADECTILEFELAMNEFSMSIDQLIRLLRQKYGKGPIRLYDPLCKVDCEGLGTDFGYLRKMQDERRRRAESIIEGKWLPTDLLADDADDSKSHTRKNRK